MPIPVGTKAPDFTLKSAAVDGLLSGLGRFGAAAQLAPLASRLEPHLVDLAVALDLGPLGSDAVGLELYAGDPSGWSGLLDTLVLLGLADRDRVDAAATITSASPVGISAPKPKTDSIRFSATKSCAATRRA